MRIRPPIDRRRSTKFGQEIGYLKNQHADQRIGAGLAEDRPGGRLRIPAVDDAVQPYKYDRMGDGRCEEHERPWQRPGDDELAADNPREKPDNRLRQAADADDALRADGTGRR